MGEEKKDRTIIDTMSDTNIAVGAVAKEELEKIKNVEIPQVGKSVLGVPGKVIDGMLLTTKVAQAQNEKEKFTEVYKWSVGTASAGIVSVGVSAGIGFLGGGPIGMVLGAGIGAAGGNWIGSNWIGESTTNEVYKFYQNIKQVTSSFAIDLYVAYESLSTFTSKPYPKRSSEDVFKNLRCLQPTTPHYNFSNKNISKSFKDTISSKTTQSPKDEVLNVK